MIKIFMWINISLFILHEMDAVYSREWKMMKFIGSLSDYSGHVLFTASHFFLFMIIFYLMENHLNIFFPAVSVLLIFHQFIHILFRKHIENRMHSRFSNIVIILLSLNSFTGLIYFFSITYKM